MYLYLDIFQDIVIIIDVILTIIIFSEHLLHLSDLEAKDELSYPTFLTVIGITLLLFV